MVRGDPVFIAWALGLVLAGLVFLVGPDRFLFHLVDTLHFVGWRVSEAFAELSANMIDAVRALALGLWVTFVALALAVVRRGGRAKVSLVLVSLGMLLLVGDAGRFDTTRWMAALVLSGVGSIVMTGRLRQSVARL